MLLVCAAALGLLGSGAQPPVYQFVIEGDTQTWSRVVTERAQWLATNTAICALQPAAVIGTGDIVDGAVATAQWTAARAAYDVLRACRLRYATPSGNHDIYTSQTTVNYGYYNSFLTSHPPTALARSPSGRSWIQTLAPGFILAVLPFQAAQTEINWMTSALRNQTARAVIVQHEAIEPSAWSFSSAVRQLMTARGSQIVGVIGGHYTPSDRVAIRRLTTGGFALFTNWQWDYPNDDVFRGWVTLLEYRTATGEWCARTRNMLTGAQGRMQAPTCVR
ncbi:MAG TPA: hypothetical protein VFT98_13715 [Myxococcota bacterium]|nr:hypothetical protein [Myxococcota bacterium]